MKRWLVVFVIAIGIVAFPRPLKAQWYSDSGLSYYLGIGMCSPEEKSTPPQIYNIRFGMGGELLSGGLNFKSDLNRVIGSVSEIEGKAYRMSLHGEFNCKCLRYLILTLSGGYGSVGTYCTDLTHTVYGVEDVRSGLEFGVGMALYLVPPYFGVSYEFVMMPGMGRADPFYESTLGFIFTF